MVLNYTKRFITGGYGRLELPKGVGGSCRRPVNGRGDNGKPHASLSTDVNK